MTGNLVVRIKFGTFFLTIAGPAAWAALLGLVAGIVALVLVLASVGGRG